MLGTWGVGLVVVGAFLMAGHLVALPSPAIAGDRLRATLLARPQADQGHWSATHVLYEGCGCSNRVLSRLVGRGARHDLVETVAYVHDGGGPAAVAALQATQARIQNAGFHFEALTPLELERRYQVESAPLLLVADAQGRAHYIGGYTDRSGGKQINDVEIIGKLLGGERVAVLPVFGCAVSSRVQQAIDPLGLKYDRRDAP
jgi:hypothetical protein